jgi:hypothetical protein
MTFRAYALLGFAAAIAAGLATAAIEDVGLAVVAVQALASAATFIALAYRSARDGRGPDLVWQRYIITAGAASVVASAATGYDALASLDVFAVGSAAQLVFGRLGCRVAGCCHGRRRRGHGRVPVPMIEAGASALVCAVALGTASTRTGLAATIVILAQSSVRFVLEEYRGDGGRHSRYGLTEAQWVAWASCVAVALGLAGRPGIAAVAVAAVVSVLALARVVTARSALAARLLAPDARARIAELAAGVDTVAPTALAGGRAVASASTVEGSRIVTISSPDEALRGRWLRGLARPGRVVAERPFEGGRVVHIVFAE